MPKGLTEGFYTDFSSDNPVYKDDSSDSSKMKKRHALIPGQVSDTVYKARGLLHKGFPKTPIDNAQGDLAEKAENLKQLISTYKQKLVTAKNRFNSKESVSKNVFIDRNYDQKDLDEIKVKPFYNTSKSSYKTNTYLARYPSTGNNYNSTHYFFGNKEIVPQMNSGMSSNTVDMQSRIMNRFTPEKKLTFRQCKELAAETGNKVFALTDPEQRDDDVYSTCLFPTADELVNLKTDHEDNLAGIAAANPGANSVLAYEADGTDQSAQGQPGGAPAPTQQDGFTTIGGASFLEGMEGETKRPTIYSTRDGNNTIYYIYMGSFRDYGHHENQRSMNLNWKLSNPDPIQNRGGGRHMVRGTIHDAARYANSFHKNGKNSIDKGVVKYFGLQYAGFGRPQEKNPPRYSGRKSEIWFGSDEGKGKFLKDPVTSTYVIAPDESRNLRPVPGSETQPNRIEQKYITGLGWTNSVYKLIDATDAEEIKKEIKAGNIGSLIPIGYVSQEQMKDKQVVSQVEFTKDEYCALKKGTASDEVVDKLKNALINAHSIGLSKGLNSVSATTTTSVVCNTDGFAGMSSIEGFFSGGKVIEGNEDGLIKVPIVAADVDRTGEVPKPLKKDGDKVIIDSKKTTVSSKHPNNSDLKDVYFGSTKGHLASIYQITDESLDTLKKKNKKHGTSKGETYYYDDLAKFFQYPDNMLNSADVTYKTFKKMYSDFFEIPQSSVSADKRTIDGKVYDLHFSGDKEKAKITSEICERICNKTSECVGYAFSSVEPIPSIAADPKTKNLAKCSLKHTNPLGIDADENSPNADAYPYVHTSEQRGVGNNFIDRVDDGSAYNRYRLDQSLKAVFDENAVIKLKNPPLVNDKTCSKISTFHPNSWVVSELANPSKSKSEQKMELKTLCDNYLTLTVDEKAELKSLQAKIDNDLQAFEKQLNYVTGYTKELTTHTKKSLGEVNLSTIQYNNLINKIAEYRDDTGKGTSTFRLDKRRAYNEAVSRKSEVYVFYIWLFISIIVIVVASMVLMNMK